MNPGKLFLFLFFSPLSLLHADSLFLPRIGNTNAVVEHRFYSLEYNEELELASWVAYELNREQVEGSFIPDMDFRSDPGVRTKSAEPGDYRGSGFDMGHLIPPEDRRLTQEGMSETFYMSSIVSLDRNFKQGVWRELEELVRTWAVEIGGIFVVSGPVLNRDNYQRIGYNQVAVPEVLYKVILDYREPEFKAIGFLLPNRESGLPLSQFAVSVDEVEAETGIDFFPYLPEAWEEPLESVFDMALWPSPAASGRTK